MFVNTSPISPDSPLQSCNIIMCVSGNPEHLKVTWYTPITWSSLAS